MSQRGLDAVTAEARESVLPNLPDVDLPVAEVSTTRVEMFVGRRLIDEQEGGGSTA